MLLISNDELVKDEGSDTVRESDVSCDYGPIVGEVFKCDWTTGSLPKHVWAEGVPAEASSASGILQLVFRILRFAR